MTPANALGVLRLCLQFHHLKDKTAVMISGTMIVRYDNGSSTLTETIAGRGQVVHFRPGLIHQSEAITDVIYTALQ
jgi:hypothetical protein